MANGRNNFNWSDERWSRINNLVHDEGARYRMIRPLLPLFGPQGGYVDSVAGHKVDERDEALRIRPGQALVPVELSAAFQLSPEQFNDEHVAEALANKAVYRVALAEDAVVLRGKGAAAFVKRLGIEERNLDEQTGLLDRQPQEVKKGILESILEGIEKLQDSYHYGEYGVIVAPDLYREAFTPRRNTLDAPIYEIRPLLKEGGFRYSPAAKPKTGVIFSLGGRTIDLAVPVDATVELIDEEKGVAFLRVVEQFRLRVNDAKAVAALA